ncbi:hypothetical protein ABL840_19440 [Variovorax sp. NFACC27]|uniref:hypothetical protein n=1 Tax=unclassified Variovorax TaxID=663243 RepID=UPI000899FEA4|nr:hypothetical protein SAMN03159371_07470 [Variovorax sp. NFACC28]SEG98887.1 hypothetical protein SAMN03159365_07379 [Variovorax sp. NFACC29]SFE15778.1 hypothetical protein SAMN03159379_07422 [Variovorax sp. NFACC26]SFH20209.1 hypothetical protein SAMN03159447_07198 [Variovorax sp. NFACC27]
MTNVQQSALRTGVERLWQEGARLAGLDAREVAATGWALLSPPSGGDGRRGGFSELNNDGSPAQLCLSQSREGTGLRMLVDPAWHLADAPARLVASREALALALERGGAGDLAPACEALLDALLLEEPALHAYPSSLLWIGTGLGQPGCAVYVDVRPLGDAVWTRTRDWLHGVLPDAAEALGTLERLRPHVQLSSIGIEGLSRQRARAKLYWRLRTPVGLAALGLPLLDDPGLAAFLATAVGLREFPLSGLVMSAGFDFASGALEDTKIDLCGHCMPQPAASWLDLVARVSHGLGLPVPPVQAALDAQHCEVAFLGAGVDRRGQHRLNIYLKPSGPDLPGALDRRALRACIASACAYLCDLQAADGGFADYRLPVGASTQWVSAFAGLALAEAAWVADLPWAFAAAGRTADRLTRDRPYAAGWGYNETTGIDADSTGFAIRLLRALGREVAPADRRSLLRHWREEGGFATYDDGPQAWGQAHPCVTAAAGLALDDEARRALSSALQACVARTALADGNWPAYWWRTHHYSTWHHLLLLRRLGQGTRGAAPAQVGMGAGTGVGAGAGKGSGGVHPSPGAFELAYAAGIAHFRDPGSAEADRLLRDLLCAQRVDGGWTGGFNLRVTDPACTAPWQRPAGELYRDQAGTITTASALFVLTEVLRG